MLSHLAKSVMILIRSARRIRDSIKKRPRYSREDRWFDQDDATHSLIKTDFRRGAARQRVDQLTRPRFVRWIVRSGDGRVAAVKNGYLTKGAGHLHFHRAARCSSRLVRSQRAHRQLSRTRATTHFTHLIPLVKR